MKTYSVKDIADILGTNPETVRRWIRSGKLKADIVSRKDGNTIREDDLYKFLRSTSKYTAFATGLATSNPLLALSTAVGVGIIGALFASMNYKSQTTERDIRILSDDVKRTIKKNISEGQESIERKKATIAELQAEIKKEQQQIRDYEAALEHMTDALLATKHVRETVKK